MKNKTPYRWLNRFENDPRILEIWDEGDDGIWVSYRDGIISPMTGCAADHEWNFRDICRSVKSTLKAYPLFS